MSLQQRISTHLNQRRYNNQSVIGEKDKIIDFEIVRHLVPIYYNLCKKNGNFSAKKLQW